MTIPYVDQSASGLRFYLVAGAVDVEPFTVIATRQLQWNHHKIEMGILGASHFLRIECGDSDVLSEVFACAEVDLERSFIKSAPFSDLPAQVQVPFEGMRYRFSPRLVCWEDGAAELCELRKQIAESSVERRTWGLEHQFPSLPGDDETKPPLTLLWAKVGGQFTLKTAHCYPNEKQIVFTTTTLSKMKG
jgi:hypothetical protein